MNKLVPLDWIIVVHQKINVHVKVVILTMEIVLVQYADYHVLHVLIEKINVHHVIPLLPLEYQIFNHSNVLVFKVIMRLVYKDHVKVIIFYYIIECSYRCLTCVTSDTNCIICTGMERSIAPGCTCN